MQNIENEWAVLNYLERIANALEERNRHLSRPPDEHKDELPPSYRCKELPVITEFVSVPDPDGGPPRVFCKDKEGTEVAGVGAVVLREMLSHLDTQRRISDDVFDRPPERQVRSADLTGPSC